MATKYTDTRELQLLQHSTSQETRSTEDQEQLAFLVSSKSDYYNDSFKETMETNVPCGGTLSQSSQGMFLDIQ